MQLTTLSLCNPSLPQRKKKKKKKNRLLLSLWFAVSRNTVPTKSIMVLVVTACHKVLSAPVICSNQGCLFFYRFVILMESVTSILVALVLIRPQPIAHRQGIRFWHVAKYFRPAYKGIWRLGLGFCHSRIQIAE